MALLAYTISTQEEQCLIRTTYVWLRWLIYSLAWHRYL
jgi:hypothetical protein